MTHIAINCEADGADVIIYVKVYSYYLDVEPLGPLIDGDLVVQGTISNAAYLPSLCCVEIATLEELEDNINAYREIFTLPPTKMMLTTEESLEDLHSEGAKKFIIPVTIPDEYKEIASSLNSSLRFKIFVQDKESVSFEEEVPDYDSPERRNEMILTVVITSSGESVSNVIPGDAGELTMGEELGDSEGEVVVAEVPQGEPSVEHFPQDAMAESPGDEDEQMSPAVPAWNNSSPTAEDYKPESALDTAENDDVEDDQVLVDIHVATDYDDVFALQSEGYSLMCTMITPEGPKSDQDNLWKFHVLGKYGDPKEPGIEDIVFVKCQKSVGTIPVMPLYKVMDDYDLSGPNEDVRKIF